MSQNTDMQAKQKKDKPSFFVKAKSWGWTTAKYLVVFLLVYSVVNWWRQPVMPANPNLQLTDYQGQSIDIEQMSHESPVLVYFWGTWCSVCKVSTPKVNAVANSSNYPVVTIAVQSGFDREIDEYLKSQNLQFTTINDETGEIFNAWQGQVTPSYVILKDGKMKQGLTGIQPEWSLKLRLWLSSIF